MKPIESDKEIVCLRTGCWGGQSGERRRTCVTRGWSEDRQDLYCFLTSNPSRTLRRAASVVSTSKWDNYAKMLWNITIRIDKYGRSIARSVVVWMGEWVCEWVCEWVSVQSVILEQDVVYIFDVSVTVHHRCNNINSQIDAKITNFIDNYNQLNMFRAIISSILRSTRLCLQLAV